MFNFFNPVKIDKTTTGSHGDHWKAVYGFNTFDEEFLLKEMSDLMDKQKGVVIRSNYERLEQFDGRLGMSLIANYPKHKMITAYPVLKSDETIPFETRKIIEWNHSDNIEAQIVGNGRGLFGLKFFATDYCENKDVYRSKKDLNVSLSGLLYVVKYTEKLPTRFATDAVAYMPNTDLPNDSAMDFFGNVLSVEPYRSKIIEGFILNCKLINHPEIEDCFNLEMFVNKNNMRMDEIKKNDRISGCCWLQGRIIK